jgi:cytochrome oxidase Cu insertion factor (SCO1/SenC/PrrC family)
LRPFDRGQQAHVPRDYPDRVTRLRWILGAAVLVLAAVAAALYVTGRPSHAAPMSAAAPASDTAAATWAAGKQRAPAFALTDQHGAPVSLAALRGRPVIVTFIDPLCRDFCPIEAQHLSAAVRSFPAAQKPAIVAVSVNVYGNARSILMEDARKWQLVPQWRWGVAQAGVLGRVWNAYHIEVIARTRTVAGVTVHTIAHTEAAYVIDANGYERALFVWPYRADGVVRVLRGLTS